MARYVALLRAINVGGHTVKMDRLRELFTKLGFTDVETFIASGNVIFQTSRRDPKRLEQDIEAHLLKSLGYEVATFIRTPAELQAISSYDPFGGAERKGLYIGFLDDAPDKAHTAKVLALRNDIDDLAVHGREIFWAINGGFSDSKISNGVLEKLLKMPATFRNVTTVTKLGAKYG